MLTQFLIPIVVTLVLTWLFRSARKRVALDPDGALELRYPPGIGWIGYGSIVFGILIGGLGFASPPSTGEVLPVVVMIAAFAVAGAYFLAEASTVVVVNEDGVAKTTIFRNRHFVGWSEIAGVRFAPLLQYLILTAANGRKIRISPLRIGFIELVRALRANLGPRAEPAATNAERYAARVGGG